MRARSAGVAPILLLALGSIAGALGGGCPRTDSEPAEGGGGPEPPPASAHFVDTTASAGVRFVHDNGATERRYLPETMGSGVAVFDADGDGWPDLYFVNGAPVAATTKSLSSGALYRNRGDGTFTDVTRRAGLDDSFVGMGAAVGDVDNDGDLDLFVTAVGRDRLYRNDGTGTFEEVGAAWGLGEGGFGASAAFLDFDRDGWLDLFAGRYVEWSVEDDVRCSPDGELRTYCTPEVYPAVSSRLYRNVGGAHFEDVTRSSGIAVPGKALGVVALDYDGDGWPDLAVANDTVRNFLFHNLGDGTFREIGVEEGLAFSPSGSTRGGMGIDAGDVDGDGRSELVVGNFSQEMSALFRSRASGPFLDEAARLGVGIPSLMTLAFGTLLFDYDGDGWLDLLLANGHIEPEIARYQPHQSHAQPAALFHNRGHGEGFELVDDAGDLSAPLVARGLATGDLDRDGDLDLVVTQNGRAARVFRNQSPARSWIGVRLVGVASNRTGYGAEVTVVAGGREIRRSLVSGRSYLSACEPELRIGLGDAPAVERVEVRWPSGRHQVVEQPEIDRVLVLEEPTG